MKHAIPRGFARQDRQYPHFSVAQNLKSPEGQMTFGAFVMGFRLVLNDVAKVDGEQRDGNKHYHQSIQLDRTPAALPGILRIFF
jgi:hypothetical protein